MSYLPEFLDGLFCYLSDQNPDVRTATLAVLGEFIVEIKEVLTVQKEKGIWNITKDLPKIEASDANILAEDKDTDSVASASTAPVSIADSSTYFSGQGIKLTLMKGITLNFGKMNEILLPHILSRGIMLQSYIYFR